MSPGHPELFRAIDKKHRIFQRKESLPRPVVQFPLAEIAHGRSRGAGRHGEQDERDLPKQLERIILQRFRPACVTVKENGDAVYFSGPDRPLSRTADRQSRHQRGEYGAGGLSHPLAQRPASGGDVRHEQVQTQCFPSARGWT